MRKGLIIGIIIMIIILVIIYYYSQKEKSGSRISKSVSQDGEWQTLSYTLPTTVVPEEFGPHYWKAIHDMASRIPCGSCRYKWETFTKFGHDFVNQRLGKPLHDQKNFDEWMDIIIKSKDEVNDDKKTKK